MKCYYGFQIGYDFEEWNLMQWCDDCKEDHPNEYNSCRNKNRSCVGKADLGSEIIATMEARRLSSRYINYNAYLCFYCGGWHIGRAFSVDE